jgi:hypothetical protein
MYGIIDALEKGMYAYICMHGSTPAYVCMDVCSISIHGCLHVISEHARMLAYMCIRRQVRIHAYMYVCMPAWMSKWSRCQTNSHLPTASTYGPRTYMPMYAWSIDVWQTAHVCMHACAHNPHISKMVLHVWMYRCTCRMHVCIHTNTWKYACTCMHVCMYVRMIVTVNMVAYMSYVSMLVCMHICAYVGMYVYMRACMCVSMNVCYVWDEYMYVCMYVCMHICIHICMYVCIHTYVCMHIYMYAYMYVCMHICMYAYMYVCMHICMRICIYVCMNAYMYAYSMYVWIHTYVCMRICAYVGMHVYMRACMCVSMNVCYVWAVHMYVSYSKQSRVCRTWSPTLTAVSTVYSNSHGKCSKLVEFNDSRRSVKQVFIIKCTYCPIGTRWYI